MDIDRGSFGLVLPDWEIAEGRVVVAKSWRPALLALLIPLGIWCGMLAFRSAGRHGEGKIYIPFAVGGVVIGFAGLLASPLRPPRRIVVTRDGVQIDARSYPAADVRDFTLEATVTRTRYGLHHRWTLKIDFSTVMRFSFMLARGQRNHATAQRVVDAMTAVLRGDKPAIQPTLRVSAPGPDGALTVAAEDSAAFEQLLATVKPPWAPEGATPKQLTTPLTEPMWADHLAQGRVIERATYGAYTIIAIDPTQAGARVMKYRWRIFVLPAEGQPPVLAVNAESSPFGTAAYGVHRGSAHVNYGECPAEVGYPAFRDHARRILGEELLGIPVA